MSDILCFTNRKLCSEDFLGRVEKIARMKPLGIVLREKDLPEKEYKILARQVCAVCQTYETPCILHSFVETAMELGHPAIHLPFPVLRELTEEKRQAFQVLGASCHSIEEAREAEKLGCTYITAGHIFPTDCKKGLPGRGLAFLKGICEGVEIPVYAIGGICEKNISQVCEAGAAGACFMSSLMVCRDPKSCLAALKEKKNEI